ncbi:MGMT family protein [Radiobacillus sp. PE A8.2]|uniref:MGMT family protein n=1 Tax=Radiobacillus sp. PE A8.2 TaxID=3380349 RepID=UPI00388F20E2
MEEFTKHVLVIIKGIPVGKVMTYGQIAKLAGSPRAARQVVRILHSLSDKYQLPWHRVVNRNGEISIADEEVARIQRWNLEGEGIEFDNNRVSLADYQM